MFCRISKKMRSVLLGLWLLLPIVVLAHSPSQSSTMLVAGKDGQWTLQIRAALTAFEHEVHEEYTAEGYGTPEEFKELMTTLLSRNLTLHINDKKVSLNNPKIMLGHETIVVYQVNVPDDLQTVKMKNTMFQSIYKSKSAFMVLKNGVQRNLFALDNATNYVAQVTIENNEFVVLNDSKSTAGISQITLFLIAFVVTLFAFALVVVLKPIRIVNTRNQSQVIPK